MKKTKKNWQSFPHEKNSGFFIIFFRCHLVFITIFALNEYLDLWDKNSAIIRRKLKERHLNLSAWLDCEKRLFFVETAGVSFWFTGNSNIVKQKDATVQKRIHKRKEKKKENSVSSTKILLWTLWWWGPFDIWVETTRTLFWLNSCHRKETMGQFYKEFFLQYYVTKPTVSEFPFVGKKTQHIFGKKMNGSVLNTEYFRDIVNIHSKGDVLWGSKQNSERKLTCFHQGARTSHFPSHSIFR